MAEPWLRSSFAQQGCLPTEGPCRWVTSSAVPRSIAAASSTIMRAHHCKSGLLATRARAGHMQKSARWCSFGGSEQLVMLLMEADGSSDAHSSAEPGTEEGVRLFRCTRRHGLVMVCSWIVACVPACVAVSTSSTIYGHSPQRVRPSLGAVTGRWGS